MPQQSLEPLRAAVYTVPARCSDVLRTLQFDDFFASYGGASFCVNTRDGWRWTSARFRSPEFTATFHSRIVLDRVMNDASQSVLGQAFLSGDLEVKGNVFALFAVADYALRHSAGLSNQLIQSLERFTSGLTRRLPRLRRSESLRRWPHDSQAVSLSIDEAPTLPGIDPPATQASAACDHAAGALEEICACLQLERADRFLHVGCGTGNLVRYAAAWRDAQAFGVTGSEAQAARATQRIADAHLQRLCCVECRDPLAEPFAPARFDKMADLDVLAQIPAAGLPHYLRALHHALQHEGLLLIHRLTRSSARGSHPCGIRSGRELETLSRELDMAESAGFEVLRVESISAMCQGNLRLHTDALLSSWPTHPSAQFGPAHRACLLNLVELGTGLDHGEIHAHRILLQRRSHTAGTATV